MSNLSASQPKCSQCGNFHPPIPTGQLCPMAKVKIPNKDGEDDDKTTEIDLTTFFSSLKNICYSQIQSKNIKDIDKLFNNVIVNITQYLENYNE